MMMPLFIPLSVLLGACIGSFCNVLIVRLHEGSSIGGRSRCVKCKKTLRAEHLIPIVSWIVLRARCAYCRAPIHPQYPAVEAAGALIGVASVATASVGDVVDPSRAAFTAAFLFTLLVITAFDLRWQLVPTEFVIGAGVVLGAWMIALGGVSALVPVVMAAVVSCTALLAIVYLSQGRLMGEGDPAVGFLIGASLGWPLGPVAIALAFLIGGACAAVLLVFGTVTGKTAVPFVPFLAAGAIVAYFFQAELLNMIHYALL